MAKAVKVTTDNKISIVELRGWGGPTWEKAIGADCTETVKTQIMYDLFQDRIVMVVDESGAIKDRPVNRLASWLYGFHNHGCPICGDVLFARQDGPEIKPAENPELLKFFLKDHFSYLEEV